MTNAVAPASNPKVVAYLARLDGAVGRLPHAEAADLVREIQAHIADKLEGSAGEVEVDRVLAGLGKPEELAANYRLELMLAKASRTFSPWLLLRTSAHWARIGLKGLAAFMIGLFGYGSGLALTVTVLMKPFIPSVGLWVGSGGSFQFGLPFTTEGKTELLGPYYAPVVTVLAFAIVVGTTQALRKMMGKRRPSIVGY